MRANFRWPLVLTQFFLKEQTNFSNFFPMSKFFVGQRGGGMAQFLPYVLVCNPLSSAFVMALVTGGSEIGQSTRSIMSKYSTRRSLVSPEP